MTTSELAALFKKLATKLESYPPDTEVVGHVMYPSHGYSGDLDGPITNMAISEMEEGDISQGLVVDVYY
jgi:hypothetical protein